MTGIKSLFKEFDEAQKVKVQLGNRKEIQVEGKGTVTLETSNGKVKLLHNVQFVPNLGYNLLSVGQVIAGGYLILFEDGACVIRYKKSGQMMINVNMTEKKMFSLQASNVQDMVLVAARLDDSQLWHLRYGHLHIKGLKLLGDKGTPMNINEKLQHEDGGEMVDARRFISLVGGLIYLLTRPDIAFSIV
ncbi:uncharacterized protein LOC110821898 [Carica papaya]|uniref:uncharacterized protein LOC110821898 n=1 Tax=Carica papaya TaxID=3649 RepID=UPI000B8C8695|nr:uncharacterized protein LOC110821898 [Carica papaya]